MNSLAGNDSHSMSSRNTMANSRSLMNEQWMSNFTRYCLAENTSTHTHSLQILITHPLSRASYEWNCTQRELLVKAPFRTDLIRSSCLIIICHRKPKINMRMSRQIQINIVIYDRDICGARQSRVDESHELKLRAPSRAMKSQLVLGTGRSIRLISIKQSSICCTQGTALLSERVLAFESF